MKSKGGFLVFAGWVFFLLGGFAPHNGIQFQGSETETATASVSDFSFPAPTGTATFWPTETVTAGDPPGATASPSETPFVTLAPTEIPTASATPTDTLTGTGTPTETGTETAGPTVTFTPSTTPLPTTTPAQPWVVISEAAWAGTAASANDEWIELWNPGAADVDLTGWTLTDNGDIQIALAGTIDAGGFFLLERTDDTTVSDLAADQIYTGALSNSGERLFLIDGAGIVMDTANGDGGGWPAGGFVPNGTMERTDPASAADSAWCGNDGIHRSGTDANGNPVNGTPRQPFSGYCLAPTPTRTRTRTITPTASESQTGTSTHTPTVTIAPTGFPRGSVVLNEVAWGGTAADANDEWIELWNPGAEPIDLAGWRLTDDGDVELYLAGSIDAGGYFILERGGDDTLSDVAAGQLYAGALSNSGEELRLIDPAGNVIDTAGAGGRAWPAGSAAPVYASMERAGIEPAAWASNNGWRMNGRDAAGNPVRGTPGRANSVLFPTPTRTKAPHTVVINEFLPKPGEDWNRDGNRDYNDEFVELYNTGTVAVDIGGWMLDDNFHGGSRRFVIPGGTWIGPKEYLVFFRSQTRIALNDGGDEIWLLAPDGTKVNGQVYTRTRWPDSGWDRFPDGAGVLRLGFPPTPGEPNRLPDDILNPKKNPPPILAGGWRRVMCGVATGPLLVGGGFLTTGDEDSLRAAEAGGWYQWWNGRCYAWSEPNPARRLPDSNLEPGSDSVLTAAGWWWEWWYLN
jgi:hypothetical protein